MSETNRSVVGKLGSIWMDSFGPRSRGEIDIATSDDLVVKLAHGGLTGVQITVVDSRIVENVVRYDSRLGSYRP